MAATVRQFFPLEKGEVPGDPELGGWRPLPNGVFMPPSVTASERDTWPVSGPHRARSYPTTEEYLVDRLQSAHSSHPLSLQEAVAVVAFRLNNFTLRSALSALAGRLHSWEDTPPLTTGR